MVHFRDKVTKEHYETIHNLSNDITLNDLEWPGPHFKVTKFFEDEYRKNGAS